MVKRLSWIVVLPLILGVTAFLIHSIHTTYMRDDEEIAFRTTRYDLAYAVRYQAENDIHAPIWFATFWAWQQFMGDTEFMGRLYAVFLTTLTLASAYRIGRDWFASTLAGAIAVIALGCNAYFLIYALEIRPYALIMLVATLSMIAFHRWLKKRTRSAAILYGLLIAIMLYIHYFLIFLIIVQLAYFLLFFGRRFSLYVNQFLTAYIVSFVLWLPWFPIVLYQIKHVSAVESDFGNARGLIGVGSTTEPTTIDSIGRLLNLMTNGQIGLYALVLLIGFMFLWRRKTYWLLFLWAIGVPLVALIVNLAIAVYTPRYLAYLSVGAGLLLAVSLGQLPGRVKWFSLLGFGVISVWSLPSQLPMNRTPFRDYFHQLTGASRPGDVILYDHANLFENLVFWQFVHYAPEYLRNNITGDLNDALHSRRIWYITQEWFDPTVQANFDRIEFSHPLQTVIGKCDRYWCFLIQLMEAPPWKDPQNLPNNLAFWGLDLDSVTHEKLEARLWWKVSQTPSMDYSIGLHVLDRDGNLVAQTDGPISHYGVETIETSMMQPGRIYIDHRTIDLPSGLKSGDYELELVVYDWRTGLRLCWPDGRDVLKLDQFTLY
jgi:hypothetical protein